MASQRPEGVIGRRALELFADLLQMVLIQGSTRVRGSRKVILDFGPLRFPFELRVQAGVSWSGESVFLDKSDSALLLRGPGNFALVMAYSSKGHHVTAVPFDITTLPESAQKAKNALAALPARSTADLIQELKPNARGIFRIKGTNAGWEPLTL